MGYWHCTLLAAASCTPCQPSRRSTPRTSITACPRCSRQSKYRTTSFLERLLCSYPTALCRIRRSSRICRSRHSMRGKRRPHVAVRLLPESLSCQTPVRSGRQIRPEALSGANMEGQRAAAATCKVPPAGCLFWRCHKARAELEVLSILWRASTGGAADLSRSASRTIL